MAIIYFDASGAPVFHSGFRFSTTLPPPPNATQPVSIDPETNPQVEARLIEDWSRIRLINGVLTRDGQPVTINADNVTLRDALTQVLMPFEKMSFMLEKNQLFVSTRSEVEARKKANAQSRKLPVNDE